MFDAVRRNQRIVQIFLGLITLPFAFWGIDSTLRMAKVGNDVATVGSSKVSMQEFDTVLREQQDQMRQRLGDNFRPELMNSTEVRMSLVNNLVDRRLLQLEATKNHVGVTKQELVQTIATMPALQEDGKFSKERYAQVLRARGMNEEYFEAKMREDMTLQKLIGGVGQSSYVTNGQAAALLRIQEEAREFSEYRIGSEQFANKVKVDPAEMQKYYDEHKSEFEVPEQVKVEYVVLSVETLMPQMPVSEAEAKDWYEKHKESYKVAEERSASHILVAIKEGVDKEAAKAKAEKVLSEVKAAPGKFADLAKQYSDDPGSARKGGDLGFFGRGTMVKPFEEAVFSQKEGEISGLVESEYGFHIVKVTGAKGGNPRSFEQVRAEVEGELKRQAALRKFADSAESFSNLAYEQSDSLKPVAEKFGLKVQQSDWLQKTVVAKKGDANPLDNEKLRTALFSDDAVKDKRNTEAVEVAQSTLVSARVVEHNDAAVKPFETVKSDIEKSLKAKAMGVLAKQEGEAKLAELQKGGDVKVDWAASKTMTRAQSRSLPIPALQAIFKADTERLPAYVGSELGDSYAIYKVTKVTRAEKVDETKSHALRAEYGSIMAEQDVAAYLAALRQRYKVTVNASAVESKDKQQ